MIRTIIIIISRMIMNGIIIVCIIVVVVAAVVVVVIITIMIHISSIMIMYDYVWRGAARRGSTRDATRRAALR